ncbi:hypothetical protein [Amycolatopsis nigrescens]|uniref:hypothetical protein n=1 Tax=Amycolatopsis nigrescens TaxID=381445 RepID=UPI0012F738EA|nr:hypothetical protein [Amycolatopsis nigrescens]
MTVRVSEGQRSRAIAIMLLQEQFEVRLAQLQQLYKLWSKYELARVPHTGRESSTETQTVDLMHTRAKHELLKAIASILDELLAYCPEPGGNAEPAHGHPNSGTTTFTVKPCPNDPQAATHLVQEIRAIYASEVGQVNSATLTINLTTAPLKVLQLLLLLVTVRDAGWRQGSGSKAASHTGHACLSYEAQERRP